MFPCIPPKEAYNLKRMSDEKKTRKDWNYGLFFTGGVILGMNWFVPGRFLFEHIVQIVGNAWVGKYC